MLRRLSRRLDRKNARQYYHISLYQRPYQPCFSAAKTVAETSQAHKHHYLPYDFQGHALLQLSNEIHLEHLQSFCWHRRDPGEWDMGDESAGGHDNRSNLLDALKILFNDGLNEAI